MMNQYQQSDLYISHNKLTDLFAQVFSPPAFAKLHADDYGDDDDGVESDDYSDYNDGDDNDGSDDDQLLTA